MTAPVADPIIVALRLMLAEIAQIRAAEKAERRAALTSGKGGLVVAQAGGAPDTPVPEFAPTEPAPSSQTAPREAQTPE